MTEFRLPVLPERLREIIRYLLTGAWNTLFGWGIYALACHYISGIHYLVLTIPCNILAVTNAFLCYKYFVFKSRGSFLKEYFKCYAVYGTGMLAGTGLLVLLVEFCHILPAIANVVSSLIVTAGSYLGHKYFSFTGK